MLKVHNSVQNKLTHAQLCEAFNQDDPKLFAALLAPDADVNVTDKRGQSMIEDIASITYQDRERIEKANRCFKMLLEHPTLSMTSEIAWNLMSALQVTDKYSGFKKIKMMLTNERVISTGVLRADINGKTLLEKFVSYGQDIIDILKAHGAICIPTVQKLVDAIGLFEDKIFTLLLGFSSSEVLNGVDGNGKTPLFHLLRTLSEWENHGMTIREQERKSMLESILRHPELNMEGVELNKPAGCTAYYQGLERESAFGSGKPYLLRLSCRECG